MYFCTLNYINKALNFVSSRQTNHKIPMKKKDILTALLLLGSTVQAQNWPEIKPEARPGSRWWWMGSAVDQKGLAYNPSPF